MRLSALRALSWELLARQRWAAWATGAYLVVACALVPFLPVSWQKPELAVGVLAVVPAGLIFVLGGLSHGTEGRLEQRAGGLPRHLFLLPVSSWALAVPPLALGALVVGGAWALAAGLVLRPCGIAAPIVWPALLGMATLAWVQAVAWVPLPSGWLRVPLFVLLVTGSSLLGGIAFEWPSPSAGLYFALGAALVSGQALAGASFSFARQGAWADEGTDAAPLRRTGTSEPLVALAAPWRAQLWLEWRGSGRLFLLVLIFCLALTLGLIHPLANVLAEPGLLEELTHLRDPVERFGPAWVAVSQFAVVLLLLSGIFGAEMGRCGRQQETHAGTSFLLAMPLAGGAFVRAKLLTAALVQGVSVASMLLLGLTWSLVAGHYGDMSDRLIQEAGSPGAALVLFVAGAFLLGALTWLALVSGMWVGLAGWRARAAGALALEATFWIVLVMLLVKAPADGRWARALVSVALVGKALLLVSVARAGVASGALGGRTALGAIVTWALIAVALSALARAQFGTWLAAGVMVLLLPIGRLLLAPVALARARHA